MATVRDLRSRGSRSSSKRSGSPISPRNTRARRRAPRRPTAPSPNSSPTCRTSCGRRSTPSSASREVMESQMFGPLGSERYLEYARDIHRAAATCSTSSTTFSTCRRSRPASSAWSARRSMLGRLIERGRARSSRCRPPKKSIKVADRHLPRTCRCSPTAARSSRSLINLLSNAVKFTGRGRPHFGAGAQRRATPSMLTIEDNGVGIPKDSRQARAAIRAGREPVHQERSVPASASPSRVRWPNCMAAR